MKWFSRGLKSRDIPRYQTETPEQKLKHIRTHIAAQAGELSNLRVELGQLRALLDRIGDQVDQVHLVTVRKPQEGVKRRG